jgi:hypothetical protein
MYFPAEKEVQNTVKDVTGLLGLKMMRLSYDETVGDDELTVGVFVHKMSVSVLTSR